jgi:Tol biopolymer transport system component
MPEAKEVFEMVTQRARPQPGALQRHGNRRRRMARNRRVGTYAVAAALIAIIIAAFTFAQRSDRGSTPATPPPSVSTSATHLKAEVVGLQGTVLRDVPGLPQEAYSLVPSPDAKRIALVAYHDFTPQIATVAADGSDLQFLTHGLGAELPAWSPDGAQIAFDGLVSPSEHALFVVDADGTNPRQLTPSETDLGFPTLWPAWSPDGSTILFTGMGERSGEFAKTQELWTVLAAGGTPVRLTHNHLCDTMGSYSPDGNQIAMFRGWAIWLMDADGSNAHAVSGAPHSSFNPKWSPDGTHLSFLTFARFLTNVRVAGQYPPAFTVHILDVGSGRITTVPVKVASDLNAPAWLSSDSLLVNRLTI